MHRSGSLLFVLAAFAAGCSHGGSNERAWESSLDIPPGATVHIRSGAGDITVRQSPAATPRVANLTASVEWRRGRSSDVSFQVNREGDQYYVCAMWKNSGHCGSNGYHGSSSGGFLEMFALFHHSADASANIVAQLPADVVVDAKTTNGSVDVEGVSSGLVAKTVNGTVTAVHVSGPMTLSTSNGNVRLSMDVVGAADSIHLATGNGRITAELPHGIDGDFDLSVRNGAVRTDLPFNNDKADRRGRTLRGQIGTSNRVVRMKVGNGSVSVTTKAAATSH